MTKNQADDSAEPREEQRSPPDRLNWMEFYTVFCLGLCPCLAFFLVGLSIFQDWTWAHLLSVPVSLLLFAAYPFLLRIRAVRSCIDGRHEFEFENRENKVCAVRGKPEMKGGGIRTTQGQECLWYQRSLSQFETKLKRNLQTYSYWDVLDFAKYGREFKLGSIQVQNEITSTFGFKVSSGYWPDPSLNKTFIKEYPEKPRDGCRKEELFYFEVLDEVIAVGTLQKRFGEWQLKRHWLIGLMLISDAESYLAQQRRFCLAICVIAGLTGLFYMGRLAVYSLYGI